MNYLVFTSEVNLNAISDHADLIESVEIQGELHVITESVYLENKAIIDPLSFEIREVLDTEWIPSEL